MTSLLNQIIDEFKSTWGGSPVEQAVLESVVSDLLDTKLRGWKLNDHLTETWTISVGAAQALMDLTRETKKAATVPSRSSDDARIDRILRVRDSNGKAQARKFR